MPEPFLKARFVGDRYENANLPLQIIREFAILEQMVVQVAKEIYFSRHQDRERVPKGFSQGFSLNITEIKNGSAILKLAIAGGVVLSQSSESEYFSEALDRIVEVVQKSEEVETTPTLDRSTLSYFDRIGRSLGDGERIEFQTGRGIVASYDQKTRHRLTRAANLKSYTERASYRGSISSVDKRSGRFRLILIDSNTVEGPLTDQHKDTIDSALLQYDERVKCLVQGIARFHTNGKISMDSVEQVTILPMLDIGLQLEEISQLEDGWYDGVGSAPDKEGCEWLADSYDTYIPQEIPNPHLYPTPEGNIRAEWSSSKTDISLEINLLDQTAYWHLLDFDTLKDGDKKLNLNDESHWKWLSTQLKLQIERGN